MKKPINIIQMGIGGMGNAWLNTIQSLDFIEHAGFVEINDAIIKKQSKKYKLDKQRIFPTLEEAIDSVQADAILDVTPPQFHRPNAFIALDSGIPVLCEKPLSDKWEDAQAIVQKSNETGVLHMVVQDYRYKTPIHTLKHVLTAEKMGAIGFIHVEFHRDVHVTGFRAEMEFPLIVDMSIHHFDLMRFLLESDPIAIKGRSWNPAWSWYKGQAAASVILDFPNNVVSYDGSWCSTGPETSWNGNWYIECENGAVELKDDEVWLHKRIGKNKTKSSKVKMLDIKYERQAHLLYELYQYVRTGKQPVTTCQDNIRSLQMVFDTLESFKLNIKG